MADPAGYAAYKRHLHRLLGAFVAGLLLFIAVMAWAEQHGLSRFWIGPIFLFLSIMLYAAIGIYGRTTDPQEYYVAGRRIPAMYNGMAAAADWMSAASFISMAGGLYTQGFGGTEDQAGGLAYVMGWTGGFCLVADLSNSEPVVFMRLLGHPRGQRHAEVIAQSLRISLVKGSQVAESFVGLSVTADAYAALAEQLIKLLIAFEGKTVREVLHRSQ